MARLHSIAVVASRLQLHQLLARSHIFCKHRLLAITSRPMSSAREEPKLPEHLQRIIDDYDRRLAEDEATVMGKRRPWLKKIIESKYANLFGMVSAGILAFGIASLDDVSSDVHTLIAWIIRKQSREAAQRIWIVAASRGWTPKDYAKDDPYMVHEAIQGMCFYNPVGLASGFDREAHGINSFFSLGFGFMEVGPVHSGVDVRAIHERIASRNKAEQLARLGVLGIDLGGSAAEIKDLVEEFGNFVDFVVIDLSLVPKSEYGEEKLTKLIAGVVRVASDIPKSDERACGLPVFLRLTENWLEESMAAEGKRNAAEVIHRAALTSGATGLIFSSGNGILSDSKFSLLKDRISEAYKSSGGQLLIIADGISTGLQALECIEVGATLVQMSSLLLTEGPYACRRVKEELNLLLSNEGYYCIKHAVGAAHRRKKKKRKPKP